MVKGEECEYMAQSIEKHLKAAKQNLQKSQEQQARYYNLRRRVVQFKAGDLVLVETHPLSSAPKKVVGKFQPKFRGPYTVLEVIRGNLALRDEKGKRFVVNMDQVRLYRPRREEDFAGPSFAGAHPTSSSTVDEAESGRTSLRSSERRGTHPISTSLGEASSEQNQGRANGKSSEARARGTQGSGGQRRSSEARQAENRTRRGMKHPRTASSQSVVPKRNRYQQGTKHQLSVQKEPPAKRFQHYREPKHRLSVQNEPQAKRVRHNREPKRPLSGTTTSRRYKRPKQDRNGAESTTRSPYQTRSRTRAQGTLQERNGREAQGRVGQAHTRMTEAEREFANWCWDRKKERSASTVANSGSMSDL